MDWRRRRERAKRAMIEPQRTRLARSFTARRTLVQDDNPRLLASGGRRAGRRNSWSMFAQTLLHKDYVVQGGDDGEDKSGAQKLGARDPNPAGRTNLEQKHKKHGADLREGVGLAKNAGAEVAQPSNRKQ